MFKETAQLITEHIDDITRRWVEDLRQTERTEAHNGMLTVEIVNGMKALLANLAATLEAHASPDDETMPMGVVLRPDQGEPPDLSAVPLPATRPLADPWTRAQQGAASHGELRHVQAFELSEVMIEYARLRHAIFNTLRVAAEERKYAVTLDIIQHIDRLLDELALISVEHFYAASVQDLEKRAIHDTLTQLYNKEYFHQRLHQELRRSLRQKEPLTVAMIDMDRLKPINDTYGHTVGDAVISAVASAIRDTSRQTDVPCRYGGDEFAVILPETTKAQGQIFAERLLRSVHNLASVVITSDQSVVTTGDLAGRERESGEGKSKDMPLVIEVPSISIGLASFPEDGRNPEMLVAKADASLYRAKREGRNRIAY
jgi:diguanylate cyclase (GGDEF)-like protein